MLRVALKEYQSRIEGLLGDKQLPEAAAHCHFLLQQYPRHIGTYRLFGRALLEQQLYSDAIDLFQRVISADPEDLIAHAGLAEAYRELHDLAKAIWHLERAFEIEPYNGAIREELRNLSARDGSSERLGYTLNRTALARLYFRGGLYPKAAIELHDLLEESPDRLDLQVLLAENLYWSEDRSDAIDQCLQIIEQLPYCIKANAILADLWLRGGRFEEAREHLNNLQSMTLLTSKEVDPNTTVGRALHAHPDISLPDNIVVEALEEFGPSVQFSHDTDWLQEIGVEGEIAVEEFERVNTVDVYIDRMSPEEAEEGPGEEDIAWLNEVIIAETVLEIGREEPVDESVYEDAALPSSQTVEDDTTIINFAGNSIEETEDLLPPLVAEPSDEINEFADDLPSWAELNQVQILDEPGSSLDFAAADWLDQLDQVAPEADFDDDLPDWLYDAVGSTDELKMPSGYELPDWLAEPVDETGGSSGETHGSESSDFSETTPPDSIGEAKIIDELPLPAGKGDDTTLVDQEANDNSSQPSPIGMIETDEKLDMGSDFPFDRTEDLDFDELGDSIPWLDDLAAESGETKVDGADSFAGEDSITFDQTDDEST